MDFLLKAARQNRCGEGNPVYEQFCIGNQFWLENYALFSALVQFSRGRLVCMATKYCGIGNHRHWRGNGLPSTN